MSGKKHVEHEEGSSERWLVSYADFITLLMVMFVVFYSMGQVDVEKYKALAQNMRDAFSFGGPIKVVDTDINKAGGKQADGTTDPIIIEGLPKRPPKSEEVAGSLTSMLQQSGLGSQVSVQTNIEGVLISLSEKLVFYPGTAELQPQGYPVLDAIIAMLIPIDNQIRVIGHTDDGSTLESRYSNNWELSVARAIMISNYMIQSGIHPQRLTVAGRGEYSPIFSNDTEEHRALNSRAEIMVIYNVESDIIDIRSTNLLNP